MRNLLFVIMAILGVAAALSYQPTAAQPQVAPAGLPFPRLAVVFYDRPWGALDALAQWDLWVGASEPTARAAVRRLNPNQQVLAYQITTEDCSRPRTLTSVERGFRDAWLLKSSRGAQFTFWRDCPMVNQSAAAPAVRDQRFTDYFADYVRNYLWGPAKGGYDGIFFDNSWERIAWKAGDYGNDIDLNRDSVNDFAQFGAGWVNQQWGEGYRQMMAMVREIVGPAAILLGGDARTNDTANGRLWEDWPEGEDSFYGAGWAAAFRNYQEWQQHHYGEFVYLVLSYPESRNDYQRMRFGLASALLGDGYFAAAAGVADHTQLWWYDEYSVDFETGWATGDASRKGYLGQPLGPPTTFPNGLWRRDFEYGSVVVNPTESAGSIALGEPFRRIRGTQDPAVNNGEVVSEVWLRPHDGIVLLRTSSTVRSLGGSDNLVQNGRFEVSTEGWEAWHASVRTTGDGRFGSGARVAYEPQSPAEPQATAMTLSNWPGVPISPLPNATYRATAWVRGEGSTIGKPVWLVIQNRSPASAVELTYSQPVTLRLGWQQVSVRHQLTRGDPTRLDVYLQLNDAVAGDAFYVDDVSLTDLTGLQSQAFLSIMAP